MEVYTVQQIFLACKFGEFNKTYSGQIESGEWKRLKEEIQAEIEKAGKLHKAVWDTIDYGQKDILAEIYDESMRKISFNIGVMAAAVPEFGQEILGAITGQLAIMDAMAREQELMDDLASYLAGLRDTPPWKK